MLPNVGSRLVARLRGASSWSETPRGCGCGCRCSQTSWLYGGLYSGCGALSQAGGYGVIHSAGCGHVRQGPSPRCCGRREKRRMGAWATPKLRSPNARCLATRLSSSRSGGGASSRLVRPLAPSSSSCGSSQLSEWGSLVNWVRSRRPQLTTSPIAHANWLCRVMMSRATCGLGYAALAAPSLLPSHRPSSAWEREALGGLVRGNIGQAVRSIPAL